MARIPSFIRLFQDTSISLHVAVKKAVKEIKVRKRYGAARFFTSRRALASVRGYSSERAELYVKLWMPRLNWL
jgi:hypothetical protein